MERDTAIGGAQGRFPATRASVVESLRSATPTIAARAAERLIALYWKPLYKYVRIRWNRSNEDAKDLIQGFFAVALERETSPPSIRRARPSARSSACSSTATRRTRSRAPDGSSAAATRIALDFDAAEAELARIATAAT